MAVTVIFVGYELELKPADQLPAPPDWEVPKSYQKDGARENWLANKQAGWERNLLGQPYTSEFKSIAMHEIGEDRDGIASWGSKGREPGKLLPVAQACKNWLVERNPGVWRNDVLYSGPCLDVPKDRVCFIGFDPRTFLKILGIECSLPFVEVGAKPDKAGDFPVIVDPAPLTLWYNNSDHRDIEKAAMADAKELPWETVLKAQHLEQGKWFGPGENAVEDLTMATALAVSLGMLE